MFDNNELFSKSAIEIAEYNKERGRVTSLKDIMEDIVEFCDEHFSARIFADNENVILIFADGDAFKLTLEKIKWVEEK